MSAMTAPCPLHRALRSGTAAAHFALERAIDHARLFDSLDGYGAWLQGWWQLQHLLEPALEGAGVQAVLPDWPGRRRASVLGCDLRAIGLQPRAAAVAPPPLCGPAELLGTCYVIEGATLGVRVLAPRIRALGPAAMAAMSFVQACLRTDAPSWRDFLAVLDAWGARVDVARSVAAAERCFALAGALLLSPQPASRSAVSPG